MSGTILLGYDIESSPENTAGFLDGAEVLHARLGVPWTVYLCGNVVERSADAIKRLVGNPAVAIAQHTYSHMLLKSVYMTPGDGKPVHGALPNFFAGGGSVAEIREEILKTQDLLLGKLGVECHGLTGPWCYYRGLQDRPDLLDVLQRAGIRWIRTYGRDQRDCQPTPFTMQPFWYADQGFPDILELCIHGYQDDFYWERFDDRHNGSTYQDYLHAMIGEVCRNDWVWSFCSHDHHTPTRQAFFETKGAFLEDFIRQAKDAGARFLTAPQYYAEMMAKRNDSK